MLWLGGWFEMFHPKQTQTRNHMPKLDAADARLLAALQVDCKLSTQELAERAALSPSPAWRRVRRMEGDGVIEGYVALVNPRAVGLNTRAYIHVSLTDHSPENIRAFEGFVAREAQITECAAITGAEDYLLKVVARDPEDLETFLMHRLLALGFVRSSTTHFVLSQKKNATALPLL